MPSKASLAARHLQAMVHADLTAHEYQSDRSKQHSPSPAPPSKAPRLRGAARGLDLDNMLEQPLIESSTEDTRCEPPTATQSQHATRSTRNGRADVNYSQKYHPMDEVTRPKRARRITGSRSLSAAAYDTDEEPELYSGESTDEDASSEAPESPAARTPDPRAVRHSSRTQAQKPVNYDSKLHPQDYAILGRRHPAKRKRHSLSANKPQKKRKREASPEEPIVLSSDKSSSSDSESDDDNNNNDIDPPVIQTTTSAASSPEKRAESPRIRRAHSNGSDSVPALPRGESSPNTVDAIIQGKHITRFRGDMQAANGRPDAGEHTADDPDSQFATKSMKDVRAAMEVFLESVKTPDAINSDEASGYHADPDQFVFEPPPTKTPTTLVTPSSMGTPGAPDKPLTQAPTQLAINRPYMTRPLNLIEFQKSDPDESSGDMSSKTLAASLKSPTSSHSGNSSPDNNDATLEEQGDEEKGHKQLEPPSDASRQAMRESSEHAARVARALAVAHQFSCESSSLDQITLETSCASTANVSRQVSRDTLPDDTNSSFFENAMIESQDCSQREHDDDDDLLRSSTLGYTHLPVSERERSDALARERCSSSNQRRKSDAGDGQQHLSNKDLGTQQPHSSAGILQQLFPSSVTLSMSTGLARQSAAGSEDSMLLKPSSV